MSSDVRCDADMFAVSLMGILDKVDVDIVAGLPDAVTKAATVGREKTAQASRSAGFRTDTKTGQRYVTGFRKKVNVNGASVDAEIGNVRAPGLVHLLEKGHAKMGGGRTSAYPHVIEGKNAADKVLEEEVGAAVDRALK